ncbi:hypothetical protein BDN67DRAFT_540135 [Paxillus ammoniavirescens]|nr:hypothetical protein BDN67DRAFT_540135 [Paxillus ammoniavirescens]
MKLGACAMVLLSRCNIHHYHRRLIYDGHHLSNWCPHDQHELTCILLFRKSLALARVVTFTFLYLYLNLPTFVCCHIQKKLLVSCE